MNEFDLEAFASLSGLMMEGELDLGDCIIKEASLDDEIVSELIRWNLSNIHYTYYDFSLNHEILSTMGLNSIVYFPCKVGYEMEYDGDRYILEEDDIVNNIQKIQSLITCFRLFKKGIVGVNYVNFKRKKKRDNKKNVNIYSFGRRIYYEVKRYDLIKGKFLGYFLEDWEKDDFKAFYRNYDKKIRSSPKNVKMAIKWLNNSYNALNYEEKILSLVIALESLYKIGSLRLIMRCSYNIGTNPSNREKIFDEIDEAINIRNKVVHGSKIKDQDISRIKDNLESNLKKSIIKFLDSEKPGDIIKILDSKIKRGD
jgi:hypothetical protein